MHMDKPAITGITTTHRAPLGVGDGRTHDREILLIQARHCYDQAELLFRSRSRPAWNERSVTVNVAWSLKRDRRLLLLSLFFQFAARGRRCGLHPRSDVTRIVEFESRVEAKLPEKLALSDRWTGSPVAVCCKQ